MVFMHRFPGRNILNIKNEIDRIYDDLIRERAAEEGASGEIIPAANIEETDKAYVLTLELPGVEKNAVKVTYNDGKLLVSGEKKAEKNLKERHFHKFEREYGIFSRIFTIPSEIKASDISASFNNGVLEIVLPKSTPNKSKEIKIEVK